MFANSPALLVKVRRNNNTDRLAVSRTGVPGETWSGCLYWRGRNTTTTTTTTSSLQSPPVHLSLFPDLPGGPTDSQCPATGAS